MKQRWNTVLKMHFLPTALLQYNSNTKEVSSQPEENPADVQNSVKFYYRQEN